MKILDKFFHKTDPHLNSFFEHPPPGRDQARTLVINDISQAINDLIEHIEEFYLSYTKMKKGKPPLKKNILLKVSIDFYNLPWQFFFVK